MLMVLQYPVTLTDLCKSFIAPEGSTNLWRKGGFAWGGLFMRLYEPVFQFVINWGHHVKSNSMIIKVLMWENATPPCCLLLC